MGNQIQWFHCKQHKVRPHYAWLNKTDNLHFSDNVYPIYTLSDIQHFTEMEWQCCHNKLYELIES